MSSDLSYTEIPKENLECLQSLFLSNPQDDLAATRSAKGDRVHGTCEWILSRDMYTTWLNEDSPQLLWLSGGPGIGKTMISSFLVDELAHLAKQSSQKTLAYYFCDDKYETRRTATAILRGILLQILRQRPALFVHIQSRFDMSRERLFTDFHGLWSVFVSIVKDPKAGEIYCLVDALDECEKESRQLFLTNFTKMFCPPQRESVFVKFIVTSRRENDIEESFSTVGSIVQNLQVDSGKVNDDLSKFIDVKVDELSTRKRFSLEMKEKIKRALTDKAGGTFLYISLVLEDLKKIKITSQVRQKLQELPSDLNKVYDRILRTIDADCEEIAKLVLRWVAVARRPLSPNELATALALCTGRREESIMPSEDRLDELKDGFKCCEPLVYFDPDNNTINLVHQSAKDYLLGRYLQENVGLSQYHTVLDSTNLLLSKTCWTYLSLEVFEHGTKTICRVEDSLFSKYDFALLELDYPFFRYANAEWQEHAFAATPALSTDYDLWKDNLNKLPTFRDTLLLCAATRGEAEVVQWLLDSGAELESKNDRSQTALSLAAMYGRDAVVKLFLDRDDVMTNSRGDYGQTPLFWAAQEGYETIVKLLLSRDDIMADTPNIFNETPLCRAAGKGHEAIVKLFLDRDDVMINSRDQSGQTPLSSAAKYGHESIVKLLLSRDDVIADLWAKAGQTALWYAAKNGHKAVVKLFLDRDDVMVNTRDENDDTLLSWAARNGYETIVKLLLSRDDVIADSLTKSHRTPLSYAAEGGYDAIVKLFLDREDVLINSCDKLNRTPLLYAAHDGHEAVVKLLLSRGDVVTNSQDIFGQTPLSYAAMKGHEGIFKLLLSRNDVIADSQDTEGRTSLSYTAEFGHEEMVKLLLSRDDVIADSQDCRSRTSLSYAANSGHEGVVKLLLNRDDVIAGSQDWSSRTPLSYATENEHEGIVKLLLGRDDVAVDSQDKYGRTPFSYAAERGSEEIVELLLCRDVRVDSQDEHSRTPLSYAAKKGSVKTVELLLSRDVRVDSQDVYGRTSLYYAARKGFKKIVKLLTSRDVRLDFQDCAGKTPLFWAKKKGHEAVARFLEQKMEDVSYEPNSRVMNDPSD